MIRSRNYYPIFQEKRDELELRPFMYQKAKTRAMFRLEEWVDRHFDIKWKAMVDQKREPFIHAGKLYFNRRDK